MEVLGGQCYCVPIAGWQVEIPEVGPRAKGHTPSGTRTLTFPGHL